VPWACSARAVPGEVYAKPWSELKLVKEGDEVRIKPGVHMEYLGTTVSPVRQNYTANLKKATSTIVVVVQGARMGQMSVRERISGLDSSAAGRQLMPLHVLISLQVPSRIWTVSRGRLTRMRMSCIFKLELTKEKKKESFRAIAQLTHMHVLKNAVLCSYCTEGQ